MIDIFVPYTKLSPVTRRCLRDYDYTAIALRNEDSYSRYLEERWKIKKSFINVEHDVAFFNGAIEELSNCPYEWCAFTRDEDRGMPDIATLCLAKFEDSFLTEHEVDWQAQREAERGMPSWQFCDSWINEQVQVKPHLHNPAVLNLNKPLLEFQDQLTALENFKDFNHTSEKYFFDVFKFTDLWNVKRLEMPDVEAAVAVLNEKWHLGVSIGELPTMADVWTYLLQMESK